MAKPRTQLPSQFPAFRHNFAIQMAEHNERIARKIQREAIRRGESPLDLAQALGVHPSTTERWFRAERTPQQRHRKQLSRHWGLPLDSFEPDLEAENKEVRAQLNRIERKLDEVLERLKKLSPPDEGEDESGPPAPSTDDPKPRLDPPGEAESPSDEEDQRRSA